MWGALIGAGIQLIGGAMTASKAKKPTTPNYDISRYQDIEARAKRKASEGMPFLDSLYAERQTALATTLGAVERGATSAQDILGAATQIQEAMNKSLLDVQMQQVNYQQQADQALTQAQLSTAQAEQNRSQMNWQSYQQKLGAYESQVSQGYGAMFSALGSVGSAFTQKYGTDQYMKTLKEISGAYVPYQLQQSNVNFSKKITSPYAFGGQQLIPSNMYNPINSTPWR